jgi:glycerol-3-phosphate acyltransferase PlsX
MSEPCVIAIDGMGGDRAPDIVVAGLARLAARRQGLRFLIFGDEALLKSQLAAQAGLSEHVEIRHTDKSVAMDMKPSQALRQGKGTSMWLSFEAVKSGEAKAAVSAGNTGALMAMSKLILRTVPGVHRPALVGSWPTRTGFSAVLDLGADITADAEQLVEFAIMGASFARAVHHKAHPSVGLLNIGSEDLKGHEEIREAARLIRDLGLDFTFHGFVEGDDIGAGTVDVVVTDGFTGNVALKTAEGVAHMIGDMLRQSMTSSLRSRIGAALLLPALKPLREKLNPSNANGGVLVGLNGVVVKSHGGSDAAGFAQAVSVAADMADSHYREEIEAGLALLMKRIDDLRAQELNKEAAQ